MPQSYWDRLRTAGALRRSRYSEQWLRGRTVKDELRANLMAKLKAGETLFPGIVGFEDTVTPHIVNAILSRHNFILLGLRGQAKTRILRQLTSLLDPALPYIQGCEIRDNPYAPLCRRCRNLVEEMGEETPIAWLRPEERYIEKLATPDVTVADMIGDIDPIKAARSGRDIGDELTIHYGLLPRANRGIFALNELPDLAGKIQVALFNIMQEGDIQIKGYPVRLPLDLQLVFTANPEDYTARGKIITPLKDRIGSEIRTHYPLTVEQGIAITEQEAWTGREGNGVATQVPPYIRQVVEAIAFLAREDKKIDHRSGVSQRMPITVLENVVSNAERRALTAGEETAVPRISDIYAALPAMTGKVELEYEGELHGTDKVVRHLIRQAVAKVFQMYFEEEDLSPVVTWFELGGHLRVDDHDGAATVLRKLSGIHGLMETAGTLVKDGNAGPAVRAAAAEFVLEGLYARRRISRSEELGFVAAEKSRSAAQPRTDPMAGGPMETLN